MSSISPNPPIPTTNRDVIAYQLSKNKIVRTQLGGKTVDVSILNAALNKTQAESVALLVRRLDQLESFTRLESFTKGKQVTSFVLRNANATEKNQGDTVITVKVIGKQNREESLDISVKGNDRLSSFVLPQLLRDVKNVQIELKLWREPLSQLIPEVLRKNIPPSPEVEAPPPPPEEDIPPPPPPLDDEVPPPPPFPKDEVPPPPLEEVHMKESPLPPKKTRDSFSYNTLLDNIIPLVKNFQTTGKINFDMITSLVKHVIDHTDVTNDDKDDIYTVKVRLEELITDYNKKEKKTSDKPSFIKDLEKHISRLKTFHDSLTEFQSAYNQKKVIKITNPFEKRAIIENQLKDKSTSELSYVLWFDDDPSVVNIAYKHPKENRYITTKSSLKDLMLTMRMINEEFANPSNRAFFQTGHSIERHQFTSPQ